MKNKIYIFGIINIIIIITACLFKIFHWTGAGPLITVGFSSYILAFMPISLFNSYRTENNKKLKTLYIFAYLCVLIVCTGALFKIQNWPGREIFLLIGIPLPFVLFLPAYLWSIRKNKQLNYNNLILVLFFFAYFASITALLSLNVSRDVLTEYIISANNNDDQLKLTNLQTNAIIESLPVCKGKDSVKIQQIKIINQKSESIYLLIDKMKAGIIRNVDNNNQLTTDEKGNYNIWKINGTDNKTIYNNPIFINKANELKNSLTEFKKNLLATIKPNDAELINYINHLIYLNEDWQNSKYGGKPMIAIIDALNLIKSNVGLAGLETIIAEDR